MVSYATACNNKLKLLRRRIQKHTSTHKPQKHMPGHSITDNSSFCNSSKTSTGNMLRPTITTTTSSTMAATAPLPLTSASKIKRCVLRVPYQTGDSPKKLRVPSVHVSGSGISCFSPSSPDQLLGLGKSSKNKAATDIRA